MDSQWRHESACRTLVWDQNKPDGKSPGFFLLISILLSQGTSHGINLSLLLSTPKASLPKEGSRVLQTYLVNKQRERPRREEVDPEPVIPEANIWHCGAIQVAEVVGGGLIGWVIAPPKPRVVLGIKIFFRVRKRWNASSVFPPFKARGCRGNIWLEEVWSLYSAYPATRTEVSSNQSISNGMWWDYTISHWYNQLFPFLAMAFWMYFLCYAICMPSEVRPQGFECVFCWTIIKPIQYCFLDSLLEDIKNRCTKSKVHLTPESQNFNVFHVESWDDNIAANCASRIDHRLATVRNNSYLDVLCPGRGWFWAWGWGRRGWRNPVGEVAVRNLRLFKELRDFPALHIKTNFCMNPYWQQNGHSTWQA